MQSFYAEAAKLQRRLERLNRKHTRAEIASEAGIGKHVLDKWLSPRVGRTPENIFTLDALLSAARAMENRAP